MPKCEICSSDIAVTIIDLNVIEGEEPLLYSVCLECEKLERHEAQRRLNEE